MPRKKKEKTEVVETKKEKTKKSTKAEVTIENSKGLYSTTTIDENGKINFQIDWEALKEHVQNALTSQEKPTKIKKTKEKVK
ncbi:MAG: hypothetical protein EBU90_16255 [Proteobacteria bacterium]|nr:hypothetical protein [Pseudomonadota bacterium]